MCLAGEKSPKAFAIECPECTSKMGSHIGHVPNILDAQYLAIDLRQDLDALIK
jgi:hypothetical protein